MGLHMEGHYLGVTKMHVGDTWRSTGNVTEKCTSNTWNIIKKFEFELHQKNLSTPWHGTMDQDWRSKMHVLKHAS